MDLLFFEDDELDILVNAINALQIIFHPSYAPCGKFSTDSILELEKKQITIFIDNNFLSPIYEIVSTGTLRNSDQIAKTSAFILFSKFIRARTTCGLALWENDSAQKATVSGEEKRQSFLYAIDKIPSTIWKSLTFGKIDSIPSMFLSNYSYEPNITKFQNADEIHYPMHQVAILKIVHLLKDTTLTGFDKFISFFDWYSDNLLIADSMVAYAALLFGNVDHVAAPKNYQSKDFSKVLCGINNQAWDMFYLSQWSTFCYEEKNDSVFMFATDDITQKEIIVNNLPENFPHLVASVFSTKKQREKLVTLFNAKLGDNRINPLKNKSKKEKVDYIRHLYNETEQSFHDKFFG